MNIYFSGIGGVGIGPLAEIAKDAGHQVTGSDLHKTTITDQLEKRGILISNNQDGSYLIECNQKKPIDLFVYTSALPSDHPELSVAYKLNIKTVKRDELITKIIDDKALKLIAIAGTHGKTTTTGMMIWTMQQLNIPISYSIGASINFGPSGKLDSSSEYFIYECDEFDRNFLSFNPYLSIITSIDYDHPDTYPTKEEYLNAFRKFALQSNQIISWSDQHKELFDDLSKAKILNLLPINQFNLAGQHNRRNASLVQNALKILGFDQDTSEILNNFPGTNRRFERLAKNLYSDYGHHPVEIEKTLQHASEISKKIVLVYQPHQNVRQNEIKDQYTNQFELAETVYWLPTYLSREDKNLKILEPIELIKRISNKEHVIVSDMDDKLWNNIKIAKNSGKLVLIMGAGNIDSWVRKKLAEEHDENND